MVTEYLKNAPGLFVSAPEDKIANELNSAEEWIHRLRTVPGHDGRTVDI